MSIFFHKENVTFSTDEEFITKWVKDSVSTLGFDMGELSLVFCSDEYLKKINIKYLNHDFFTDVIAFDYSREKLLFGDIYNYGLLIFVLNLKILFRFENSTLLIDSKELGRNLP